MPDYNDPLYRRYGDTLREEDSLPRGPIPVGRNILVLPAGNRPAPGDGRLVLHLDSRYAFGDGRHPTTILCMTLLEEYLTGLSPSERNGLFMLDLGTGTGVLAILRSVIPLAARLSLPGAPVIVIGIGDASREEMEELMRDSGFTVTAHLLSGWWHAYLLLR